MKEKHEVSLGSSTGFVRWAAYETGLWMVAASTCLLIARASSTEVEAYSMLYNTS